MLPLSSSSLKRAATSTTRTIRAERRTSVSPGANFPDVDIKNLTPDGAAAIYRKHYWDEFRCGELPPGLDFAMFDAAVQHLPGLP